MQKWLALTKVGFCMAPIVAPTLRSDRIFGRQSPSYAVGSRSLSTLEIVVPSRRDWLKTGKHESVNFLVMVVVALSRTFLDILKQGTNKPLYNKLRRRGKPL